MSDAPPVRTPLYAEHLALDGRMVDFHGFELPIWYSSISEEHLATRSGAGLFDVSHMGLFRFTGADVRGWLQGLATQAVTSIAPGRCAYTHFLDEDGLLIDDMIFAVVSEEEILGVPNASMIPVMLDWFSRHLPEDGSVQIEDLSDATAILALQGPQAKAILTSVLGEGAHVGRFRWGPLDGAALRLQREITRKRERAPHQRLLYCTGCAPLLPYISSRTGPRRIPRGEIYCVVTIRAQTARPPRRATRGASRR